MRADTGDLENEDTVVVKKIVNLAEEGLVATDTDVLQDKVSTQIVGGGRTRTSAISKLTIFV